MATSIASLFYRGAAATSSATLYTSPTSTTSVLTDVIVSNNDVNQQTVTISIDGVVLLPAVPISGNTLVNFQFRSVFAAGKLITGFASSTNVTLHLSGVQIA